MSAGVVQRNALDIESMPCAERNVLICALQGEFEDCSRRRWNHERLLIRGDLSYPDEIARGAAQCELHLAALDSLLGKMPTWWREVVTR